MNPDDFDFVTPNTTNLPDGYPASFQGDSYSREPFEPGYDRRKALYLEFCANNPARPTLKGFLYELARLATGTRPVNWRAVEVALDFIHHRIDCSDFVLLGILRLVLQFRSAVPQRILDKTTQTILSFKYWPDEPGQDSMCTWTENHQILFSACEYLAGMMYPDEVFSNSGHTGHQKKARARRRLLRWLELRFRTGFNEWLSNVYYDEDISALVTLHDFCEDASIAAGAACILDLLFLDMSLNSFKGTFGSTHGRSYEQQKKSAFHESTADTQKLVFGTGVFGAEDNMSAIHLALSHSYRPPKVVYDIAADVEAPELTNTQRIGLKIAEAPHWGIGYDNLDDGMVLLSFEAYFHPSTISLFVHMLDAWNWWDNGFFSALKRMKRPIRLMQKLRLLGPVAWLFRKDIARNMREEVHTVTYRTPDYMLSAALDYKKGWGGDQQHIWQATLSEDAVCFTTHPGSLSYRSPDYWTGSGFLPRVGMHKNVLIAVYKLSSAPALYVRNRFDFTHAYFPREKFDEVAEQNGWLFGRKGDGYIALHARNGYRWQTEGKDRNAEIISDGAQNIWVCETGNAATHGSFAGFRESISTAELRFRGLRVHYHSPSRGQIEFGWRGAYRENGRPIPLRHTLRYDNPFCRAPHDPAVIEVNKGGEWMRLELDGFKRTHSRTV
ncbi:MAG: hypothetical protein Kow0099_08920 [Candidatus Abyssubacteria bacterium]